MVWSRTVTVSLQSEALILRNRPYGESDLIVTFLAEEAGKLTGIAKGAKNSRRRFANCLGTFTRVRVHYKIRRDASLVFMESCDLLQPATDLSDPARLAYGSYLIELVDLLTEEAHPVPGVFRLLGEAIERLRHGPATGPFLRAFELHLLCDAGYEPQFLTCARCHHDIAPTEQAYVEAMHPGIICAACLQPAESIVAVDGRTLAFVDSLKTLPLAETQNLRPNGDVARQAARILGALLAPHLRRPLRSLKMIAALAP